MVIKMNVPKLRFKEFTNDWKEYILNNQSDVRDGTHDSPKYIDYGFPLITSKNLKDNGTLDLENVNYLNKEDFDKINLRSKVDIGDILFGMIGTIGKPVRVNRNDFAIKNVALIKEKGLIKNDYLIHYLQTTSIKKQFANNMDGGTQKFIALEKIRKLKISQPNRDEQLKLVNMFNLLDKKIELQSQKIEALKLYKKGLLLNYFKGKKTNKIIKDIIKYGKAGGTPKSSVKEYYNGKIPFLSISDMTKQGKYIYNTERNISEIGLKNSSAWLVPEDSIILSMYASYGLVAINKIKLSTSQAMFNMILNDNVFVEYIYQYLNYLNISNYYDKLISTGTQSNLNAEKIYNIKIFIPEFNEQKLIANLLNCIDIIIEFNIKKKKNYHKLKKGLMQNMFV